MDFMSKFNTLVDRSTQAVDDSRRIFDKIEKFITPPDNGETENQKYSILALTDIGFSDASFV